MYVCMYVSSYIFLYYGNDNERVNNFDAYSVILAIITPPIIIISAAHDHHQAASLKQHYGCHDYYGIDGPSSLLCI